MAGFRCLALLQFTPEQMALLRKSPTKDSSVHKDNDIQNSSKTASESTIAAKRDTATRTIVSTKDTSTIVASGPYPLPTAPVKLSSETSNSGSDTSSIAVRF